MQYWVFYLGGVGGDGFVNLLDNANNVEPADGIKRWRYSTMPNGKVKFHQPEWCKDSRLFRNKDYAAYFTRMYPNPYYVKLILNGTNTAIPVHLTFHYLEIISKHPFRPIFENSVHKIWLYSNDIERVISDFFDKTPNNTYCRKNLTASYRNFDIEKFTEKRLYKGFFDTYIDIEKVWRDWNYLNDTLTSIGINISKSVYDEYLIVSKRP